MKKKNKKLIIVLVTLAVLLLIGLTVYLVLNFKNENSLTLEENQWIDSNKKNVIDIAVMNDIPVLSYDGKGLVYNFLDYVSDNLSLKFNVISYKLDEISSYDYKIDIVDSPKENDIVLLKDNFVLITKNGVEYNNINEIDNLKIGVLASDKANISSYLNNNNIQYVDYNSYSELKNAISNIESTTDNTQDPNVQVDTTIVPVDGIIISKTIFTKEMIENDYKIAYQFSDLNKYFVLTMNGSNVLNSILNKNYSTWKAEYYDESYNNSLLENYYKFKKLSDVDQKNLKSKSYVYGFINYGIYNYLDGDEISGLSGLILKDFN